MKISSAFLTHPGKVRSQNQDGLFVGGIILGEGKMIAPVIDSQELRDNRGLYAVVDGAGGHSAGEVACKTILSELSGVAERLTISEIDIKQVLTHEFIEIQNKMTAMADDNPVLTGMAAVIAGVWFTQNSVVAFNCGDSRVYRMRGGFLNKVTHDHSVVQQLCDQGIIREEDMRIHPEKNRITAALEASGPLVELSAHPIELQKQERFFLCCDGVWEAVSLEKLEECIGEPSLSDGAEKLFDALMDSECKDNISFIILDIDDL